MPVLKNTKDNTTQVEGTNLARCVRAQIRKPQRARMVGKINHTSTHNTTITDTEEINVMNESSKPPLVIAFVVVVVLFLIFGGGAMTGSMMGGGMMGRGWIGGYRMGQGWINGGFSWMWIPTFLTLGLGVLLGWLIFGKK
jgi:hypothetical protein